jgi:hypothetical protein
MGVLSALPLVSAGNACCCLWVVCGGLTAAYVFQQNQTAPIAPGDGALVGLLAGLIGAVVYLVVSIPVSIVVGPFERALMQRIADMAGTSPEMREAIERYGSTDRGGVGFFIVGRVVSFIFMLFVGAIFSTLGGLLGAAVFRKSPPPPPQPPVVIEDIPPT